MTVELILPEHVPESIHPFPGASAFHEHPFPGEVALLRHQGLSEVRPVAKEPVRWIPQAFEKGVCHLETRAQDGGSVGRRTEMHCPIAHADDVLHLSLGQNKGFDCPLEALEGGAQTDGAELLVVQSRSVGQQQERVFVCGAELDEENRVPAPERGFAQVFQCNGCQDPGPLLVSLDPSLQGVREPSARGPDQLGNTLRYGMVACAAAGRSVDALRHEPKLVHGL